MTIDETASIVDSTLGEVELREYVTVHDSELADGVRVYERTSVKKSVFDGPTVVNANCYVENARLGERVQVGPNASIVGVTHDLTDTGMEFGNDRFEEIVVEDGAFVGAGAVVLPGVTVGENAVVGAGTTVSTDVPSECVVRAESNTRTREL
ncbi:acyltransferase [Halorussus limi]|uniref:Acyltransferase n=1 Tax=Halorussus limi TaxID=2938695 RepID=A0A8U0HRE1_9EURY|nr:DapH/DapD/GlmU-related protein [Halorussus limi]UPV73448.1 acyltransferase [Halorussus limi]